MSKNVLEAVERLVEELTPAEQLRVYHKVEATTHQERLQELLSRIRRRTARMPLSEQRLKQICDEVRQELYEERSRIRH